MPAWEREFATAAEANAFASKHEAMGDIIFSNGRVLSGGLRAIFAAK